MADEPRGARCERDARLLGRWRDLLMPGQELRETEPVEAIREAQDRERRWW